MCSEQFHRKAPLKTETETKTVSFLQCENNKNNTFLTIWASLHSVFKNSFVDFSITISLVLKLKIETAHKYVPTHELKKCFLTETIFLLDVLAPLCNINIYWGFKKVKCVGVRGAGSRYNTENQYLHFVRFQTLSMQQDYLTFAPKILEEFKNTISWSLRPVLTWYLYNDM